MYKENEQVYATRSVILVCSSRGRNSGSD